MRRMQFLFPALLLFSVTLAVFGEEAAAKQPAPRRRRPPVPTMEFAPRADFERNFALLTEKLRRQGPPRVAPQMKVEKSEQLDGYTRQLVSYRTEENERVEGYLLIPDGLQPGEKRPLMLCLHGTNIFGKDAPVDNYAAYPPAKAKESTPRDYRVYAAELVRRGFVCFAPDRPGYGKRCPVQPATGAPGMNLYIKEFNERYPDWDYHYGKVIHDLQQALDFLTQLDFVDAANIGSIGHSLGGRDTLVLAAFEPRIKAAVVSSGGNLNYREELWTGAEAQQRFIEKENIRGQGNNSNFLWQAIAPRRLLVIMALNDYLFDYPKNGIDAARPMKMYYDFLNGDTSSLLTVAPFMLLLHTAGHNTPPDVRAGAYGFLGKHLGKK